MGLDMYMVRVDNKTCKPIKEDNCVVSFDSKTDEVAYWRKQNMLHHFILEQTGADPNMNCTYVEVPYEVLYEFIGRANDILKARGHNREFLAKKLLPTHSGFFFGSTEYDKWYYESLKSIRADFRSIIQTTNFVNQTLYYSCWW